MSCSDALRPLVFLCALSGIGHAKAGVIYRCESDAGAARYAQAPIDGMRCSAIKRFTPAPPQPSADVAVLLPLPAGRPTAQGGGAIYSYTVNGMRKYASSPPPPELGAIDLRTIRYTYIDTCFACGLLPATNFRTVTIDRTAYQAEITAASREFGVDAAFVRAIMHAESAFNPTALSKAGAQGLMQLMPTTAQRFGVADAFDADQNIRGGVQYLAFLLRRYQGNTTLAAAGYNAGEGAVDKYQGVPPFAETRRYVARVGELLTRYSTPVQ